MKINEFDKISRQFDFTEGINGKEDYVNAAVLVLLIPVGDEYHFVMQKRNSKLKQGGEICFAGGKVETYDNSLADTAIRETSEELGISKEKIQLAGRLNTIVAPMGVIVDAFIGIAEVTLEEMNINKAEVESVFSIPISFFLKVKPEQHSVRVRLESSYKDKKTGEEIVLLPVQQLGLPERYNEPWGNLKYHVYVYQTTYGAIRGLTARLNCEVIHKIKELTGELYKNKKIDNITDIL